MFQMVWGQHEANRKEINKKVGLRIKRLYFSFHGRYARKKLFFQKHLDEAILTSS